MTQPVNNESRVPRFEFAATLEEQLSQLAANPLMTRFRESRDRLAGDRYRPHYHFVSPESTLNDPNGLCRWRDKWHLFYQGYPPEERRQHWGHAVSEDLIHWQDLPYAIYPGPERRCFSGATLAEENRVIAMYHGTAAGNMVAVCEDPLLLNWRKLGDGPVIPIPEDGSKTPYRVFDPCIWRHGDFYYSLSAGFQYHEPSGLRLRQDFLFRSPDLVRWEYLHPFLENDIFGLPGDDGACPYFWPIGDRHILLHFSHISGGKYILGAYDAERQKFVASGGGRFNFGAAWPSGVHAPSATPDGEGGVIAIFNMNPGKPTGEWDQILSLPRRLTLVGDELEMEPAGDIASLRSDHVRIESLPLPANREVVLDRVAGDTLELDLEVDTGTAPMVELDVLRSPGRDERTRIAFFRGRGLRDWRRYGGWAPSELAAATDSLITIDSAYSSLAADVLSRAPETAPIYVALDEPLRLRVFIDKSVVEVFVNGRQCVALRVYPTRADSIGVSARAQGSNAMVTRLDAWQLGTIY